MLRILDTFNIYIERLIQIMLMIGGVIMLVVNLAQVAGRYLFFYSIPWSEELSTYMYAWIIFFALHFAAKDRNELSIDALRISNPKVQNILVFSREFIGFVTCIVLLVGSIIFIQNSFHFPKRTASLGITVAGLYFCMPISFGLIAIQKLTNIFHDIAGFIGNSGNNNSIQTN